MMRSTIESLIKLPLQIADEVSVRSKKDAEPKSQVNKSAHKKDTDNNADDTNEVLPQVETTAYSQGYIKYPRYDFF